MKPGTIIILNGPSSSGKTSILRELQNMLEEPFLEAGIDKFIWMLPKRYLNRPLWDDVLGKADTAGQYGHQLVTGMHRAIEVLSLSGLNVLADHVLVEESWRRDCAVRFGRLPAFLVGIRCPLEVLEEREKERRDRTLGQARLQYGVIHEPGFYDVEVDTSRNSVRECARLVAEQLTAQIAAPIGSGLKPTAFSRLEQYYNQTKPQ